MLTCAEIRRLRLLSLIERYGTISALNEALGWPRTDPKISQIKNENVRKDRSGSIYRMGDAMAREIEEKLNLERGWMDNSPTYAEIHGTDDKPTLAAQVMEKLPNSMQEVGLRLLHSLAEPAQAEGRE